MGRDMMVTFIFKFHFGFYHGCTIMEAPSSWKNHGRTMEESWKNHGRPIFKP
jgi:hypothetical protein